MNIFVVDENPIAAANQLCDKHIVKMVTESAQMLSTAHRLLDGEMYVEKNANGRNVKRWRLNDDRENVLMKAVHMGHPCTVWTMTSASNYIWHYGHYKELSEEYTRRYGKKHGAFYNNDIGERLKSMPRSIANIGPTPYAIAMNHYPECIVPNDPIQSYRNYYNLAKARFAKWTNREVPYWYLGKVA